MCRVALGSVIPGLSGRGRAVINVARAADWFVMAEMKNRPAGQTDIGIKNVHPPSMTKTAPRLGKECKRFFKMMKDINEDQI